MGRPREFDMDIALKGAMDIFWRQGYTATNLPDLLDAMGLTRGSFYKAFKDKESAYLAALDQYDRDIVARTVEALDTCDAKTAGACLALLFAAPSEPGRGCFICNAMIELGPIQNDVAERTSRMTERLIGAIEKVLNRYAQVESAREAREKADLILHLYFGHQALGKAAMARDDWLSRLDHVLGTPAV